MFPNGVAGWEVDFERLDAGEAVPRQPPRHASWRGFGVSMFKDKKAMAILAGGILTGVVGTLIGIGERSPEVYIAFPIINVLAEGTYFGFKACQYFERRNRGLEESGNHVSMPDRARMHGAETKCDEDVGSIYEGRRFLVENDRASSSGNTVTDMEFLKDFESEYFNSESIKIESAISFFQELKNRFPDYFVKHQEIKSQHLFLDKEQCKTIIEGVFKCYEKELNQQSEYRVLATMDDGNCLYDALWQGLSSGIQEGLVQKCQETLDELATQEESRYSPYLALKILLCRAADKEKYRELIQTNSQEPRMIQYSSIEEYKPLVMENGLFWGRHNIEGRILAEELDVNLTLIGGWDYTRQAGFVCRENEEIYTSRTAKATLYISNSYQHYSAAEKQARGSSDHVSSA
ncbi:hypothetical protein [Endozoicomonas sp.]|uniref:hypothetical protein n=1 Tax=Endozoicomonas sp. TaxID=1892382 RepID=UPI002885ADEC|nr:hypothetical protein [Endozoicomonas sp.]